MSQAEKSRRIRVLVQGRIQGVGFRPFVSRLATRLALGGWVANTRDGVTIELEGKGSAICDFLERLPSEAPPKARIDHLETDERSTTGQISFVIKSESLASEVPGLKPRPATDLLPDLAPCQECVNELFDPRNRRYRHAFITCTNCGPRFSIQQSLPFDRTNTTMGLFPMCSACVAEYNNPADRRFHAQTISCHQCGPKLSLWNRVGMRLTGGEDALGAAVEGIRSGRIVAVKAVGGFQLFVDAQCQQAVELLRQRKRRPEKPFALMMPSLKAVQDICALSKPIYSSQPSKFTW